MQKKLNWPKMLNLGASKPGVIGGPPSDPEGEGARDMESMRPPSEPSSL